MQALLPLAGLLVLPLKLSGAVPVPQASGDDVCIKEHGRDIFQCQSPPTALMPIIMATDTISSDGEPVMTAAIQANLTRNGYTTYSLSESGSPSQANPFITVTEETPLPTSAEVPVIPDGMSPVLDNADDLIDADNESDGGEDIPGGKLAKLV
jgi:hypothetical protein